MWYEQTPAARAARLALLPLSWTYAAAVALRNALYDARLIRARASAVPVISVGNLSVGGTGKTPLAAFLVRELKTMGYSPAVVMRGYGDDEPLLHARLNPAVPVFTGADRAASIQRAALAGADVVVMDDGFQHRRAARDLDVVLVAAERWADSHRLLPAGPARESLRALRRAGLVVVTRKSATVPDARAVAHQLARIVGPATGIVVASIQPHTLISVLRAEPAPLAVIRGASIMAIAGIGDPTSFFDQLRQLGGTVEEHRFRDHHHYSATDVAKLLARASSHKYVITTEKDAVKLQRFWPVTGPRLWYLSQAVSLTQGSDVFSAALANVFTRATPTVG